MDNIRFCKCGCRQKLNNPKSSYLRGHIARVKNNWGHNATAQKRSKETQKRMYENGELIAWNKGLTKETDPRVKKYAVKLFGREITWKDKMKSPKSEGHKEKLSFAAKNSIKAREAQLKNIQIANKVISFRNNKLEQKFLLNYPEYSNWNRQEYVNGHLVDFVNHNEKIVIEIYGDYWHCNPKEWSPEKYHSRLKMNAIDKWNEDSNRIKKIEESGYLVKIFWESQIKGKQ